MEGMMNKWEKGPVKLANGEEAWIDAINEGQEDWRYTGRVRKYTGRAPSRSDHWTACGWHANGRLMFAEKDHECNLAPPPKKTVRVKACILVYEDGSTISTSSDESDLSEAKKHAFALVEFDREVTEGEGL
jgi:hypothetical protein